MSAVVLELPRPAAAGQKPAPAVRTDELLRTYDLIESLASDWLFRVSTPEGRAKMLREHGLAA